jgi:hypothetical protein
MPIGTLRNVWGYALAYGGEGNNPFIGEMNFALTSEEVSI